MVVGWWDSAVARWWDKEVMRLQSDIGRLPDHAPRPLALLFDDLGLSRYLDELLVAFEALGT